MPFAINGNTRLAAVVAVVLLLVLAFLAYVVFKARGEAIDCGNGDSRRAIDLRDFTTRYWAYSVEFEAAIKDRAKLAAKLQPTQLQQLSEAMQQGREFRQFVVAGYNACAISKKQYADFGATFQALDGLARRIDQSAGHEAQLAELVRQYVALSQTLGRP